MLRIHEPRAWGAVVIVGVCLFAVASGVDVVAFALADLSAGGDVARLTPWTAKRGVASLALRRIVDDSTAEDVDRRRGEVVELLSHAPLDASAWVTLATLRLDGGQTEKGLAALAMASLTGPNEGWIMARRAVLGLTLWQALPPDSRQRAAADSVESWQYVPAVKRSALRAVLRLQTPSVRDEMRAALLRADGASVADALGLRAAR